MLHQTSHAEEETAGSSGLLEGLFEQEPFQECQPTPPVFTEFTFSRSDGCASLRLVRSERTHSLWGNQLWNAARYISSKLDAREINVEGKCVLELGSGLGVPSLVSAANGARLVVATDYPDPAVMDLLERNVSANKDAVLSEAARRRGEHESVRHHFGSEESLQVVPLLWGNLEHIRRVSRIASGGGYDVMILADLVFNHVCHDALLYTVSRCLAKNPTSAAYVAFSHHRALRVQEDLAFFSRASEYGLAVRQLDCDASLPLMFPNDPGPSEVRQPVWCYVLSHVFDAAGAPCDDAEVDVAVIGTGLVECLISAAAAKSRLKVLHLDAADFYGGPFAGGRVAEFEHIARRFDPVNFTTHTPAIDVMRRAIEGEQDPVRAASLRKDVEQLESMLHSHKLSLDLNPFVQLADSDLLTELANCQMSTHLEYQNVSRLAIIDATTFPRRTVTCVPLSRAAAFKSKALSAMDMRRLVALVKELSGVPDRPEGTEAEDHTAQPLDGAVIADNICRSMPQPPATLRDVLRSKYRIAPGLEELLTVGGTLLDAALSSPRSGLRTLHTVVASVGKYGGATPFLVPQYSASEVPQLMCRMSAVWEGSFVLRRTVSALEVASSSCPRTNTAVATTKEVFSRKPQGCGVILSNGQRIAAKALVVPGGCVRMDGPPPPRDAFHWSPLSRVILVLRAPALTWADLEPDAVDQDDIAEREMRESVPVPLVVGTLIFRRPPREPSASADTVHASVVQLSAASVHAPPGWSVVHCSAPASAATPSELYSAAIAAMCAEPYDAVVYAASYTLSPEACVRQSLCVDPTTSDAVLLDAPASQVALGCASGQKLSASHVDRSAVTVVPVAAFIPHGLDDDRYLSEAMDAFDVIKDLCGLPADEPFLAPSPATATKS